MKNDMEKNIINTDIMEKDIIKKDITKIVLSVLILVLILLLPEIVSANIIAEPVLPSSILPGSYFPLTVKITNTDLSAINDLQVDLNLPRYLSADNDDREINSLNPGQSIVMQWSIKVNQDAPTGYDTLMIEIDYNDTDSELEVPFLIKSIESSLEITDLKTNPNKIIPGASSTLTLTLQNHASYKLKDVKVLLDLTQSDFAPKDGTEERIIEVMDGRSISTLDFELTSLPKSEPGIYKIPVKISYFDEFGQKYEKLNTIALEISAVPRLEIATEGQLIKGKPGKVTLQFINQGLTPVKFLSININSKKVISSHNIYIGDLDIDDFQTEELTLLANDAFIIPITLDYRDANNQQYHEERSIPIQVLDQASARKLGLESSSNWPYFLGLLAVVVVSYIIWKKIFKKQ